jgi:hypothetical protein
MPSFKYQGRRIGYVEYGSSPRVIVLVHGLVMDGRMYSKLAPTLATGGHEDRYDDKLSVHGSFAMSSIESSPIA